MDDYGAQMIVFVHGVPETAALWNRLRALLGRESVALSLPGFGSARPRGFTATKDVYADWLRDELGKIGGPIDLVGHDWGAGLTYRVVTAHGDLVRSWVADVANIMHPDYQWHDFARTWQTPGDGEAFLERQAAISTEAKAARFESMGVERTDAVALAEAADATMAGCILDLYRSATPNPYAGWHNDFGPTSATGLVLHPSVDPYGDETMAREVASMLHAGFLTLDGLGHWWASQAPEVVAPKLLEFWSALD